jgi:hypothetical protein
MDTKISAVKRTPVTKGQATRVRHAIGRWHIGTADDLLFFTEEDASETKLRLDVHADQHAACTAELRACGFEIVSVFEPYTYRD